MAAVLVCSLSARPGRYPCRLNRLLKLLLPLIIQIFITNLVTGICAANIQFLIHKNPQQINHLRLNELKLSIENVNPAVLWGPNNDHFEIIKKQYPKLKIVARGNDVKVLGDDNEISVFQEKFTQLLQHVEKYESLNITDVERIVGGRGLNTSTEPVDGAVDKSTTGEVIVFGPNGIMVK